MEWAPAPHRPYKVWFHRDATHVEQLVFKAPTALPRERVYGPLPEPPAYNAALAMAQRAVALAGGDNHVETQEALDTAWKMFSSAAEKEIAGATDHMHIKKGQRGGVPQTAMVEVFIKKRKLEDFAAIRDGWRWLAAATRTACRLAQPPAEATAANSLRSAHCDAILDAEYPGVGLLNRLDRQAAILRDVLGMLPAEAAPEGSQGADEKWRKDLNDLLEEVELEDDTAGKAFTRSEADFWDAWREEAFAKGARGMHRATKLKAGWSPTVVDDGAGGQTSAPEVVLQRQSEELGHYWHSEAWAAPAWMPKEREALPTLEPSRLREVAKTYPASTSGTVDGFHPRHFSFVTDAALQVMATLFQAVELLGLWPSQLAVIMVQLIEKPKGGYRPICLFAAAVRLWERTRRRECQQWCARWSRSYWAFTAGAGAELTVWRQQARAEAGTASKDQVAGGSAEGYAQTLRIG